MSSTTFIATALVFVPAVPQSLADQLGETQNPRVDGGRPNGFRRSRLELVGRSQACSERNEAPQSSRDTRVGSYETVLRGRPVLLVLPTVPAGGLFPASPPIRAFPRKIPRVLLNDRPTCAAQSGNARLG